MKKIVLFIVNTFLFLLLLSLACVPLLLLISYIDIVFGTAIEASYFTLFVVIGAWLAGVVLLYFVAPKKLYGSLPGSALVGLIARSGASIKPLIVYGVSAGVFLASGYISIYVNSYIFGRMVAKEEKTLESLGMSFDWKSYFPQMDYKDPDNAAPYIEEAKELFSKEQIDKIDGLWKVVVGENDYDFSKAMKELKTHSIAVARPVGAFEKAIMHKKFLMDAYKDKNALEAMSFKVPPFSAIKTFVQLRMLEAISMASKGNWNGARKNISDAVVLTNLLGQSPTMVGYLIKAANETIIRNGLIFIVKRAVDKGEALNLVESVIVRFSVDRDAFTNIIKAECAVFLAMQEMILNKSADMGTLPAESGMRWLSVVVSSPYYEVFGLWDRYVYLRAVEITLKHIEESDNVRRKINEKEFGKFLKYNSNLPAFLTSISMFSYHPYYRRKFIRDAGWDVALFFASAVHYKSKFHNYPATLDKLVPAYMQELPVNPINGKPYIYKTSGGYMEVIAEDEDGSKAFSASIGKRPQ